MTKTNNFLNACPVFQQLSFFGCLLLIIGVGNMAKAQVDTVHYIPPIANLSSVGNYHKLIITTNETNPFEVTVKNKNGTFQRTVSISSAAPAEVDLFNANRDFLGVVESIDSTNMMSNYQGLVARGDQPFFVNAVHVVPSQAGILTSKGRTGLGQDFYSGHINSVPGNAGRVNFIGVMATQDNTNITFDNPRIAFDGQPNTFTVKLNALQTYLITANLNTLQSGEPNDYFGTHITSNKPIAVNSGSWLGGGVSTAQDAGIDQLVPTRYAGSDYILIKGNGGQDHPNEVPVIVATEPNTEVYLRGSTIAFYTLANPGDHLALAESEYVNGVLDFKTSKPVFVYQTLSGSGTTATPGMMLVPSLNPCAATRLSVSKIANLGNVTLYMVTKAGAELAINGIPVAGAIVPSGNQEWDAYKISDLTPFSTSDSNFVVTSSAALSAAATIESGLHGAGGYYSGFGASQARAGIERLGIHLDTVRCIKPIQLLAGGGDAYRWSGQDQGQLSTLDGSETIFQPLVSGTYTFTVSIDGACLVGELGNSIDLTVVVLPFEIDAGPDLEICFGDTVQILADTTFQNREVLQEIWAVNAGGTPYRSTSGTDYETGTNLANGKSGFTMEPITGTQENTLYTTVVDGSELSIEKELVNGTYELTLQFAEICWDIPGQRIFDVGVEGQSWISDLDLVAEVGKYAAYDITRNVIVSDGKLNIDLSATVGAATLSGLRLTKKAVPSDRSYFWAPDSDVSDASVAQPGVFPKETTLYTLTVTDEYGCQATDQVEVVVQEKSVAIIAPAGPFCADTVPLLLQANYPEGIWDGNGIVNQEEGVFDAGTAGEGVHTITFFPTIDCPLADSIEVEVFSATIPVIDNTGPFCTNDPVTELNVSGPAGNWFGPGLEPIGASNFDPSFSGPGNHTIYYETTGRCQRSDTLEITVFAIPEPKINVPSPVCSDTSQYNVSVDLGGGTWSGDILNGGNTIIPSNENVGEHWVYYTVTSLQGCTATDSVSVIILRTPTPFISPIDPVCVVAEPVVLEVSETGGRWSGKGILSPLSGEFDPSHADTGRHWISYTTDAGGYCERSDSIEVQIDSDYSIQLLEAGPFCADQEEVTLEAIATGAGWWSGDGITDTASGIFSPGLFVDGGLANITYQIPGACGNTATMEITVHRVPNPQILGKHIFCQGEPIYEFTSTEVGGIWSGEGVVDSKFGLFSPDSAGIGTVELSYFIVTNECSGFDKVMVEVDQVTLDIISVDTLCEKRTGDQIVLVPETRGDVQYLWNTGATSTSLTVDTAGVYSVTVTNENLCWAKGTVTIVNDCGCNLYLPNAFTPDQDGLNDVFFVYGAPPVLFEMYIYDRWGVEIFHSQDITKGWDGTYQGLPAKSDVYTVKGTCPDDGDFMGRVTLLR